MPGETQSRFLPRAPIRTEALNRLASSVESATFVETPGLYRDSGGTSLIDPFDLFLAEITDIVPDSGSIYDGAANGLGNLYWYSWRAVRHSETGELLDVDPPASGTASYLALTDRAVVSGLYTPDRLMKGDLVVLRKGLGQTYEVWARAGHRDCLFLKVTSSVTAGALTCTGVPVVRAFNFGLLAYEWVTAPFSSTAMTWRLEASVGNPSPIQGNVYFGRRILTVKSGSNIEYTYGIHVSGISVYFPTAQSESGKGDAPHPTAGPITVSRLQFGPDFQYDLTGAGSGGTAIIDPYVADRFMPGIVTANYLGSDNLPYTYPRFSAGYQWLGNDTKCVHSLFVHTAGSIIFGSTDSTNYTSYAPPVLGTSGALTKPSLVISSGGPAQSASMYSPVGVTLTTNLGSQYAGFASTGLSTALFGLGLGVSFSQANSGFLLDQVVATIGHGSVTPSSWTLTGDGFPTGPGSMNFTGDTAVKFSGLVIVSSTVDSLNPAQLHIGQNILGMGANDQPGVLYVNTNGLIHCKANGVVKPSDSTTGYTGSVMGLDFVNGWCTSASLSDPGADSLLFWDDSAGALAWLTLGSGLTITGTTISSSGGGGGGSSGEDITTTSWMGF